MKEEEIINKAKDFIIFMDDVIKNHLDYDYEENITAYEDKALVQGLLDLYQKEKEKNINLTQELEKRKWVKIKENGEVEPAFFISKDKIRAKIKELEKEQEENRKNLSIGIELLSNKIIDKFSNKIMINLGIREYLENILKESKNERNIV